MKFVNLGTSLVSLDNLKTAEPFHGATYGPSIKLEYSDKKDISFVRFKTMDEANAAFNKLVDEINKAGLSN